MTIWVTALCPARRRWGIAIAVVSLLAVSGCSRVRSGAAKPTSPPGGSATTAAPATTSTPAGPSPTTAATTSSSAPSGPAGGPVPAGFSPSSFTAVSDTAWWLLGVAPCSHPPCTSVVRTTDGGSHFAGLPAPTTTRVRQLRFADPADGFASGPDLWVTHDGGGRWHQVAMTGDVTTLVVSDGYVFAVAGGTLYRSPTGSDAWTALSASNLNPSLALHGTDVVTETQSSQSTPSRVLVSHDRGVHFASYPSPDVDLSCTFDEPVTAVVWALCVTGLQSALTRSSDGGATFPPLSNSQGFVNTAGLAAVSATRAVVTALASGAQVMYLTTDGGRTFQIVGPRLPPGGASWGFVGFTDATHGVAIATTTPASLYRTTDGGHSWNPVSIRA